MDKLKQSDCIECSDNRASGNFCRICGRPLAGTWQDQPTEDGYYWFDDSDHGIMFAEFRKSKHAGLTRVNFLGNLHDYTVSEVAGKWYGPIKPPEEE